MYDIDDVMHDEVFWQEVDVDRGQRTHSVLLPYVGAKNVSAHLEESFLSRNQRQRCKCSASPVAPPF